MSRNIIHILERSDNCVCVRRDIPARLQGTAEQRGGQETRLADDAVRLRLLQRQDLLLPRTDRDGEEEVRVCKVSSGKCRFPSVG